MIYDFTYRISSIVTVITGQENEQRKMDQHKVGRECKKQRQEAPPGIKPSNSPF